MAKRPIYYDTETTGVRPKEDRIIEIAAFDPLLNTTFCQFVNPLMPIPAESTQICGITDEMVKDANTFADVGKAFLDFCKGDVVLIAHNNDRFDKFFLIEECKRSSLILPNFAYIDTLLWARKYRSDLPKHSLQYLREVYNVKQNNAHRALDDVQVLHQVFSQMIDDLTMEQVIDLLYSQASSEILQMPFGKHKGEPLNKLPKFYLKWLAGSGALEKPENEALKQSLEKLGLLT